MLIDSVKRPVKKRQPLPRTPIKETGARFTKLKTKQTRRWSMQWSVVIPVLASPLLFVAASLGNAVAVGVVILYGLIALLTRLPSAVSFTLALSALLYVVGLQVSNVQDIAVVMATLAYGLLAVGIVAFAIEAQRDGKVRFRR